MVRRRSILITTFVIAWTLVFGYETLRAHYLSPLLKHPLPKLPLLFPPAGWIMFFNVDRGYGFAEVYGVNHGVAARIEPHRIFSTRAVGYDNIHRNVLVGVLDGGRAKDFCPYVRRKFPGYETFIVVYGNYPDVVATPDQVVRRVAYQCQ